MERGDIFNPTPNYIFRSNAPKFDTYADFVEYIGVLTNNFMVLGIENDNDHHRYDIICKLYETCYENFNLISQNNTRAKRFYLAWTTSLKRHISESENASMDATRLKSIYRKFKSMDLNYYL